MQTQPVLVFGVKGEQDLFMVGRNLPDATLEQNLTVGKKMRGKKHQSHPADATHQEQPHLAERDPRSQLSPDCASDRLQRQHLAGGLDEIVKDRRSHQRGNHRHHHQCGKQLRRYDPTLKSDVDNDQFHQASRIHERPDPKRFAVRYSRSTSR